MALGWPSLLVLVVTLRESCFGASSHSMKYFSTAISEPSQGKPYFVIVGYVDGQVFVHYDSHSQRMKPRVSWMEKFGKEDPQYWDRESQKQWRAEERFSDGLEILRSRYNQSEGLHTWQRMYGCELQSDGSKGGFWQYGYEGRTFITFDKETLTWVAPDPQAQITQRKWDADPGRNQGRKAYLEEICIEWLEKYLSYGNEMLLRTALHRRLQELWTQSALTQTLPLEENLHPFEPGDWVWIKSFTRTSPLQPKWTGPYQILLTTQTAIKVAEKDSWIHWTHAKPGVVDNSPTIPPIKLKKNPDTEEWTLQAFFEQNELD